MIQIDIRPVWRFTVNGADRDLDLLLIALLESLHDDGKLTRAATAAGISYRHAWNLIAQWQAFFGSPLVVRERGRGTTLTPLGSKLLWAGQRARERLAPELRNLGNEFAQALNAALSRPTHSLIAHTSHDYAMAQVASLAAADGLSLDTQCRGSFDALAALARGECDLAGFHIPEGAFGELMARRYAECLPPGHYAVIAFARRTQGFIVRPGNPKRIRGVADLARRGVRMVNRQRGSGTRALLEFLFNAEGIERATLKGYANEEMTHGAVAALVAGNQADVGFGVEAAAAQYRLGFMPYGRERYYLACAVAHLESPAVRSLMRTLHSPAFQALIASLPGYDAPDAGTLLDPAIVLAGHAAKSTTDPHHPKETTP